MGFLGLLIGRFQHYDTFYIGSLELRLREVDVLSFVVPYALSCMTVLVIRIQGKFDSEPAPTKKTVKNDEAVMTTPKRTASGIGIYATPNSVEAIKTK